ncbi:MAG TPA: hydroxyacid dehydrogenase [Ktedonobacteraceae bacterium]
MAQAHIWTGRTLQPESIAILDSLATVTTSSIGERNDWYAEASTANVILVAGETYVTGDLMDRIGSQLRIIARTGIGVDRIDLDAATRRGIMVVNAPDGPTESTAEHAIALLLNLCKRVMVGDRILRSGQPFPSLSNLTPGFEVSGALLGLVGLGRIGSRVAAIAQVLGMKVLAYDPFVASERATMLGVNLVPSLEELLPRAQVVSLHCPSTMETYHIIHAGTLRLMPRGSYLINVARGALIDEAALLDALRSGHLAGAALDVYDPEPPIANHPLFTLPNTICTPHIGSYTVAGVLRMQVMACEQIASALRGERPTNLVNVQVWGQQRS